MTEPETSPSFALLGIAGYVAPRHLKAMREIGGTLRAAMDPADSVGIIDSYFPYAAFFTEFERFDRFIDKERRMGRPVDYISICSPNYLHDAHVRFALRADAHAICEKPLVLNPWNVDALADIERTSGRRVNAILQLRLHPAILALKEQVAAAPPARVHNVDVTYVTSRGPWYYVSWKGDEKKSGGIATNIGIHFFDALDFVFGPLKEAVVHHRSIDVASGYLEYRRARVRWFLSINRRDLPSRLPDDRGTFRSFAVDGEEIEFSGGFTDLHTASYERIVEGEGFTLEDARPSVEVASRIRNAPVVPPDGNAHPALLTLGTDGDRYDNGWPV